MSSLIRILIEKGVRFPNPESVEIGPEVNTDRISAEKVVIHSGCKLFGKNTLICKGTQLGYESPVTVDNCYIGENNRLDGGFYHGAVFLGDNQMGLGAHVRAGTILEERAKGAHTVALKQTILFPFVTLGSLINFCDCFMAGGTSRKDHSEVGSSYIHFNYTPNQDKATPSLIGDVPRGVMLDQAPIFLGGQGGLVGPCRIEFGNVIAAGSIYRKDVSDSGQLLIGNQGRGGRIPFKKGVYPNISRIILNNLIYIGNLYALMQWYKHVRTPFFAESFSQRLFSGLVKTLNVNIDERLKRIKDLITRLPESLSMLKAAAGEDSISSNMRYHDGLIKHGRKVMDTLDLCRNTTIGDERLRDDFLSVVSSQAGGSYIHAIQELPRKGKHTGTKWLNGIVDEIVGEVTAILP